VAAVSLSGPIQRLTRKPGQRYGELVAQAASRVEAATG
jgi:DNA-binding IclR family transcriptional regulator